MVKYEGIEKRFFYNIEDVRKILEILSKVKYWKADYCSREEITRLVGEINDFISTIRIEEKSSILERHETEEEAREYFGQEFINKFENILSILDKQHTILALHGTHLDVCPQICDEGLQNLSPTIDSTAVRKDLNMGDGNVHYKNYEELLNWGHKNYKGLVMVAIPYGCFYKEGLWEHYQETDRRFHSLVQNYRIPADFIVGFIDVINKNIVINPKYNRTHDYSNLVKDLEIYRKNAIVNEEELIRQMKEAHTKFDYETQKNDESEPKEEKIDVELSLYGIERLICVFNSMTMNYEEGLKEENYRDLLQEISIILSNFQKIIPFLKTQEEILAEQSKFSVFDTPSSNDETQNQISDLEDDIDWDFPSLEDEITQIKR